MPVFTGGPYGRLACMLNTLSSLNIEIIITEHISFKGMSLLLTPPDHFHTV